VLIEGNTMLTSRMILKNNKHKIFINMLKEALMGKRKKMLDQQKMA
jgi:hypothetical protein